MKSPQYAADQAPAFELKGSALTLMVLFLLDGNTETIIAQLDRKFGQTSGFFRNAPVLLDLGAVREGGRRIDFPSLLAALRALSLVPVAVRGGNGIQNDDALAAGLGLLPETRGGREVEISAAPASTSATAAKRQSPGAAPPLPVKVISQPVRSGQRIVADGDLIVLAPVGSGSEILAGRNIHVYGALRGRALAGARGDAEARIFCLQFNPELVAIAGEYLVNEELNQEHVGHPVLVSLEDDRLKVESFGTYPPK